MTLYYAKISYKSGKYDAYVEGDDDYRAGDKVKIMVVSGYETTGVILSICERMTKTSKCHATIIKEDKTILEEEFIMFGAKTVEVKHVSSDRTGIFYTDLDLKVGDVVVYDSGALHVGVVTSIDPDSVSASNWVVDLVRLQAHRERLARAKEAQKLLAKLNAKKKQFQDIELLRLIAANDPETKEMLDQYTSLIGNMTTGS